MAVTVNDKDFGKINIKKYMKTKIEIDSSALLDSVRYNLQTQLTTDELVKFAVNLGEKLTNKYDFYTKLAKKSKEIFFDLRSEKMSKNEN